MTFFLVEDPELSESIKAFEKIHLFMGHQFRGYPLLQFQKTAIIDPPQDGKDKTTKESFFFIVETAVEVDEEGFSLFRNEDVSLMSQIQVDDSSLMDFSQHLFQVGEERRLKGLSSFDGSSWDKFHGKSKVINSLNSLRNTMNSLQLRVYLPFLMNEPESQCPTKKKIFPPNILDHEGAAFHLHSI
jgi:hypothetical protein